MAIGQNWRKMTKADIAQGLIDIGGYTQIVDQTLSDMPPVADFLTNVSLKESYAGAGLDSTATHTLGPWQIDPIKMYDLQQRMLNDPKFAKRRQDINDYFANQGHVGFDIANLAQVNRVQNAKGEWEYSYGNLGPHARDPQAHAFLARLGIAPYAEAVPDDIFGQADYWKKYWNTKAGKGKAPQFIDMLMDHRPDYFEQRAMPDYLMYQNRKHKKAFPTAP